MVKDTSKEPPAWKGEAPPPVSWKDPSFPSSELLALFFLLLASAGVGTTLPPTVVTSFLCPKGEGSRQLLDAKVKLITNTRCNSYRLYDHMIDETMICAGNLQKPGPDTCQVRVSKCTWGARGWQDLTWAQRPRRALGWEAGSAAHLPQGTGTGGRICPLRI